MSADPAFAVEARDFVTVLSCSRRQFLTKVFDGDNVQSYDQVKHFSVAVEEVNDIRALSTLLERLSGSRNRAIIRGRFVGDAAAQEILPPRKPGMYRRVSALFPDVPHHWVCFDIDKYAFSGDDWRAAVELFILEMLPEPFAGVTYHVQFSSSMGRVPGVLKAKLFFWLRKPVSSEVLRGWARAEGLKVDKALFSPVQLHYIADPVFRGGAVDPVAERGVPRNMLVPGACDEVDIQIDADYALVRELPREAPLADPALKPGWIGAFHRVYSVEDVVEQWLPEIFEWEGGEAGRRLTYLRGSGAAGGAFVTDDRKHVVNMHDSDPCENRAVNLFDLVRIHLYGHLDIDAKEGTSPTKLPSHQALVQRLRSDDRILAAMVATPNSLGDDDDGGKSGEEGEGNGSWQSELAINDAGQIIVNINNILLCLRHVDELRRGLWHDAFQNRLVINESLPWVEKERAFDWQRDLPALKAWLERRLPLASQIGRELLTDALYAHSFVFSRHPVRDYLMSLRWDGVERIDTFFERHAGVEENAHLRECSRKIFLAAAKRILEPGCKFDLMPVLIGPMGYGKSSLIRALSPCEEWTGDTPPPIEREKELKEWVQGRWLIESAEMANVTGHARIELVKAFLSSPVDRYRAPYAREPIDRPRQFILFGTSNEEAISHDDAGNRRVIPLTVTKKIDIKAVTEERDQLWAEAVHALAQGEPHWPSIETERYLVSQVLEHHTEDSGIGEAAAIIEAWLDEPVPEDYLDAGLSDKMTVRKFVCVQEILRECHNLPKIPHWIQDRRFVGRALKKIGGWKRLQKAKRHGKYGVQKVWARE